MKNLLTNPGSAVNDHQNGSGGNLPSTIVTIMADKYFASSLQTVSE